MQTITSRPIDIKKDIDTIYMMASNPATLNPYLEKFRDKIPAKKVELSEKQIIVDTGIMGEVVLKQSNSIAPNLVEYKADKSPVPLTLSISLTSEEANRTLGQITLHISVPVFLSGMVRSKVNPILAEVANTLEKIDFDRLMKIKK